MEAYDGDVSNWEVNNSPQNKRPKFTMENGKKWEKEKKWKKEKKWENGKIKNGNIKIRKNKKMRENKNGGKMMENGKKGEKRGNPTLAEFENYDTSTEMLE